MVRTRIACRRLYLARCGVEWLVLLGALAQAGIGDARPLSAIDRLGDAPVAMSAADTRAKAAFSNPAKSVAQAALTSLTQPAAASARFSSIHFEERLAVPSFITIDPRAGATGAAAAVAGMSPEFAARVHLKGLADLYRISAAEVDAAPLHHVDRLPSGATIARFTSHRDGIEVFRESAAVMMDRAGQALAVGGNIGSTQTIAPLAKSARGNFTLTSREAIAIALGDYAFEPAVSGQFIQRQPTRDAAAHAAAGYEYFTLPDNRASADGARLAAPARAKRVWFRLPEGLVSAYYVELQMDDMRDGSSDGYGYVIAADDGRLLFRKNHTADAAFTYKVWAETGGILVPFPGPQGRASTPHPTGLNDGFLPPSIAPNSITLQNGPISTNDPWLPAGATQTIGNNVEAWANHSGPAPVSPATDARDGTFDPDPNECDLMAPQVADFHACTSSPGTFDYTYNTALDPKSSKAQVMAATTQLFYVTNWLHDWYYDAGFREIDGNAQTSNFGRGGLGNDSMKAQAQDYAGLNNAFMNTPADGARPRMRMDIFTGNGAGAFTATTPPALAGDYEAKTASFGPQSFDLAGTFMQALDPSDTAGTLTTDGCSPLTNAAAINGNIAVIDRGNCGFVFKARNAQNAGALGVLILNSSTGAFLGLASSDTAITITIPVLQVSFATGQSIKAQLAGGVTGRLRRLGVVDHDGSIDNAVVAHEWGHYISNRLIGNANGITTNMSAGLGEGWADFHAMLMMVKAEDAMVAANANFGGTYAMPGYTSEDPKIPGVGTSIGHYSGFRRYPYSTNLAKNPLTFKHIQNNTALPTSPPPAFGDATNNAEVHSTGEIWASMLWGCYASLLRDTGRLTFDQAQDRMKRYIVAAYKITPINPTLIEARNALLAAIGANDPADVGPCLDAFAARGAGLGALSGDRYSGSNAGVVESFVAGGDLQIAAMDIDAKAGLYCDADAYLDNSETGKLRVTVRNIGGTTLSALPLTVSTLSAGVSFSSGNVLVLPDIPAFGSVTALIDIALSGTNVVSTADITASITSGAFAVPGTRTATFSLQVRRDRALAASTSDDVEDTVTVWTPSLAPGTTDTSLSWLRVTEASGNHIWKGPSGRAAGLAYLTSPSLKVSAAGPLAFTMRHRYQFEFSGSNHYDGGVIEISSDGGMTWVDVNSVIPGIYGTSTISNYAGTLNPLAGRPGFGGSNGEFLVNQSFTFPASFNNKNVLIRFAVGTDDGGSLPGWDIDDIVFSGIDNTPFPGYVTDAQGCISASAAAGTPQSGIVNSLYDTRLQLLVQNIGAQPLPGAPVTFTAPASGAGGTFAGGGTQASTVTNAAGLATAPAFTANGALGAFNVVATAGIRTVNYALTNVTASSPVTFIGVGSRKDHGPTGPMELVVDETQAINGAITVEPRATGAGHTLVFHFSGPVSSAGNVAVVDPQSGGMPGGTALPSGNDVVVSLFGIADNHRATVTLTGVNGATNASASLGFLVGDVNGSRSVTPTDIQQIKARAGQATNAGNFRFDLNTSGIIGAADIASVKARSGLVLP